MKKWKMVARVTTLALAAALMGGCAGTVKLVDPAYMPETLAACRDRDANLMRGNLVGVATKTFGAAADLTLAPFVALAEVFVGRTKDAYAHTTGARDALCAQLEAEAAEGQ